MREIIFLLILLGVILIASKFNVSVLISDEFYRKKIRKTNTYVIILTKKEESRYIIGVEKSDKSKENLDFIYSLNKFGSSDRKIGKAAVGGI